MKTQYTPEPWSFSDPQIDNSCHFERYQCNVHVGLENRGNTIAIVYLGGNGGTSASKNDVTANARLISAAPNLLNMLQRMVDETTGGFTPCLCTLEHARAAIAKAIGE